MFFRLSYRNREGFSLVELLVVIAIIGILAAVGITAYSGYTANAKAKAATAQNKDIINLLNSEFARCASGEGDYAWSTTTSMDAQVDDPESEDVLDMITETTVTVTPDSCASDPDDTNIVAYINTNLGLKNPYETDVASAIDTGSPGLGLTSITCSGENCIIVTNIAGVETTAVTVGTY